MSNKTYLSIDAIKNGSIPSSKLESSLELNVKAIEGGDDVNGGFSMVFTDDNELEITTNGSTDFSTLTLYDSGLKLDMTADGWNGSPSIEMGWENYGGDDAEAYIKVDGKSVSLEGHTHNYAATTHNHNASAITGGTISIARIPTGTTNTTVSRGDHIHSYLPLSGGTLSGSLTAPTIVVSGTNHSATLKMNQSSLEIDKELMLTAGGSADICQGIACAMKVDRMQVKNLFSNNIILGNSANGSSSNMSFNIQKYGSISSQAPAQLTNLMTVTLNGDVIAKNGFYGNYISSLGDGDELNIYGGDTMYANPTITLGYGEYGDGIRLSTYDSNANDHTELYVDGNGLHIEVYSEVDGDSTHTEIGYGYFKVGNKNVSLEGHTHSNYLTGYTEQYKGTVTGVMMNGTTKNPSNGVVNLGTVITAHQDISGKVDKVSGKGLSTNDYTAAEKTKLAGIASGAEVNVQSDWNETNTSSDAYIWNKPTIPVNTDYSGTTEALHYAPSTSASTVSASSGKYISGIKVDSKNHVIGVAEGTLPSFTEQYKGTVTGVTAGNGLTGGGSKSSAGATGLTLNIGQGTGIAVTADAVSISDDYQTKIANGATAYGWGNHSGKYLPSSGGTLSGSLTAPAFYETSDERLKTFGDDIKVDFEKLSKLRKSYFTFNDDSNKQHIGVSAQEVKDIYPEIVSENENGYLSVDYSKLSVIALKAVDELYKEVSEIKEMLKEIKK